MSLFDSVKEKVSHAANSVSGKTREGVEITKLIAEGKSIESDIRSLYSRLGHAYYESKGGDAAALEALCAEIEEKQMKLRDIEDRKLQIRNQTRCPGCGTVVAEDARFCSVCGMRQPELPKEEIETPENADVAYCPDCGAMRKGDDRFCEICGHDFEAAPEAAEDIRPQYEQPAEDSEAPTDFNAE